MESSTVVEETVAAPVESEADKRMRDELVRLSVESLRNFLERFGYEAKPDVSKKDLVDAVMKIQAANIKQSEEMVQKAVVDAQVEDDPIVTMTFENLESPGTDITFTYRKGGFYMKPGSKKVEPLPKWHFYSGHSYEVPLSVVDHLNSLKNPVDRKANISDDGMIRSLYSEEKQNRFSCRIDFTDEQRKMLLKGNKT